MKSRFKISGKLMVAALLASILELPTAAVSQSPVVIPITPVASNASLADTLTWLKSFLPTATGGKDNDGFVATSSIAAAGGCEISISTLEERPDLPAGTGYPRTDSEEFSLSDIDPATAGVVSLDGVFQVYGNTRAGLKAVKASNSPSGPTSTVVVRYFADQASAQRVANAFQHAAQLCANASPF